MPRRELAEQAGDTSGVGGRGGSDSHSRSPIVDVSAIANVVAEAATPFDAFFTVFNAFEINHFRYIICSYREEWKIIIPEIQRDFPIPVLGR